MTARAHVKGDFFNRGVEILVAHFHEGGQNVGLNFGPVSRSIAEEGSSAEPGIQPLRLYEDEARALYEALGAHFGGNVQDARQLRKDYEAERLRVDKFITHLTTVQP